MTKDTNVPYTFWMNDMSKKNTIKLIKHCDKKIDQYFAKLDKKIERIVKAEVKKIMKGRKTK